MEFLVRTTTHTNGLTPDEVAGLRASERARAIDLSHQGILLRLWRVPGQHAAIGLWKVEDATMLHEVLSSLPLFPWMTVEVESLATHPMERQVAAENDGGVRLASGD